MEELEAIKASSKAIWDAMPYAWAQLLEADYQERAKELNA